MNLFVYQDKDYKVFLDKLLKGDFNTIGIRTPILRKLAREMAKDNYINFIKEPHTYYEEKLLHGFILGYIKVPFKDILKYLDTFIPYIDNWAINDQVAASLHIFSDNKEEGYQYILNLLKGNIWSKRFGLVLLLDYYVNDEYIDNILEMSIYIDSTNYYVMMSLAWLLSVCYIKYPKKTMKVIKNKKLTNEVKYKTISKICDSYRVSEEDKIALKTL